MKKRKKQKNKVKNETQGVPGDRFIWLVCLGALLAMSLLFFFLSSSEAEIHEPRILKNLNTLDTK